MPGAHVPSGALPRVLQSKKPVNQPEMRQQSPDQGASIGPDMDKPACPLTVGIPIHLH